VLILVKLEDGMAAVLPTTIMVTAPFGVNSVASGVSL